MRQIMRRSTRITSKKASVASDSSDEENSEEELHKKPLKKCDVKKIQNSDSSSESDIENYLQPADQIDLNSSFFQTGKSKEINSFEAIESNIFSGVNRLSESESEPEQDEVFCEKKETKNKEPKPTTSKINFQQLHEYTQKIEEAKKFVEKYEAQKKIKQNKQKHIANKKSDEEELDISELLALGETKVESLVKPQTSVHSSDFESLSDSEKEDWEEVEDDTTKHSIIPKDGVQITLELPGMVKKKKGMDLVACMKRRLNRIKKENQVYVHKVHLLCWLAHGNYVNQFLNNQELLALGLSLIPSQHCYPSDRTDLSYLEQIVKWFKDSIPVIDKLYSKEEPLIKLLKIQISRKQAFNKKMLVYMFICVLRSLGIQCRLVLSFQVAPLRPPASELHSLSTKSEDNKEKKVKSEQKEKSTNSTSNKAGTAKKDEKCGIEKSETVREQKSQKLNLGNLNSKESTKDKMSKSTKSESTSKKLNQPDEKSKGTIHKTNPSATTSKLAKSVSEKKVMSEKSRSHSKSKSGEKSTPVKSHSTLKIDKNKTIQSPSHKIPQLDGAGDTDDSEASTLQNIKKPNLKKLTQEEKNSCPIKKHSKRLKSLPASEEMEVDQVSKVPNNNKQNVSKSSSTNLKKLKKSKSSSLLDLKSTEKSKSGPRSSQSLDRSLYFNQNSSGRRGDIRNDIISIMKGRMAQERDVEHSKLVKSRRHRNQSDCDSDYAPKAIKKKRRDSDEFYEENKVKVKRRVRVKKDDDDEEQKQKKGVDVWVEVFLESEEKWISADVTKGKVHCIRELYTRASHPIMYIVAWNNDNSLKDITQRYCPNWNTVTRKLRIDNKWWQKTLKPFEGRKIARDREEDEELARLQLEQPLPTSIAEYKNHPLYALKRHLLKFQALYPPQPIVLGFVKNEAVYSRDCVHTLHSREVWIKYAKVVKPGEEPYKIVKARAKYDKLSGQVVTDKPLELFGKWQVGDYVPPIAENGIVPRNAYGNVELFKPCMLPKGTVHLHLPGLNKIAKKMDIDCAPAVVGFDFHTGGSHPTFDGFVVCEEHSESLIAAWYMEQEEQEKREQEKLEKRVYGNWRKLIKGLLIRERLKARYNFGGPSEAGGKKRNSKAPKFVSKKRRICSNSESDAD
ncbi:hypothetical protein ILUMI_11209 [Ignelater luminosus]|uniref:Uncharacterized protein n=1 Tax=Ignelater luminosus TaxID=2038154 RepID=A0A8K0GDG2_IGNLU|nr:hypothetical protein ILUMI_11209 [Ignelater luminosus]